jgi:predicted transcriptional regulator
LVNIFGKNLLDDETQLPGYRELCGLEKFKPFECVGEIEESVYAALKTGEDFKNDYIIRKIREELPPTDVKKLEKKIFRVNKRNHSLGRELFAVLEEACERWGDGAQASRGKKS